MAITFNENDYNISKIKRQSKLNNLLTKHPYYVFGLRQEQNNVIKIIYNRYDFEIGEQVEKLVALFQKNKMRVEVTNEAEEDYGKIGIGMRKDIREHVILSASVLQTAIYGMEGRLKFNQREIPNIPGIPTFTIDKKKEKS